MTFRKLFPSMAALAVVWSAGAWAHEREAAINGGRASLFGTLETPDLTVAPGPAVLLLAGSGPTDRDGNSAGGQPVNTLQQLAHGFAAAGIASLRVDKRGIGRSAGAYASEATLTIGSYAQDAVAWSKWLAAQPNVTCVVIAGHSEGALIAFLAAQHVKVCGVISFEGPGRRLADNLSQQLRRILSPDVANEADKILVELAAGRPVVKIDPALAGFFRPSIQPYLISEYVLDPAEEARKVRVPLLVTAGTRDAKITMEDFKVLVAARPDAIRVIVPDMIHPLKIVPAGLPKPAGGLAGVEVAPPLLAAAIAFIRSLKP